MSSRASIRIIALFLGVCAFVLVALGIDFDSRIHERQSEPKQFVFVTNYSKEEPEVSVTLDDSVIFDGKVQTTNIRPAIVFSRRLDLPSGQHTIRFEDRTRGITEVKTFGTPGTRTIFVGMEKIPITNDHIVFYKELIHPK